MTQAAHFASVLAKIGFERSRLVSDTKLASLAESRSTDEFAARLRDTTYGEKTAKIKPPINSRKVEHALKETLLETYAKIIINAPDYAQDFLRFKLIAFEIENVKILVKAIAAKFVLEEKLARIYPSVEDILKHHSVFEEAYRAEDLRALVHSLRKTAYSEALRLGLKRYEEIGSVQGFDIELDRDYHEKLLAAFQALPRNAKHYALFYCSIDTDSFILLTVLRGKILSYDPNFLRLSIPRHGFKIPKETTEALVMSPDFDSAFSLGQKYYSNLTRAESPEETVVNAEKVFRRMLFEHANKSVIDQTFNVGAPLAFMAQKEVETENMKTIAVGLESALKPQDIQSELLLQS